MNLLNMSKVRTKIPAGLLAFAFPAILMTPAPAQAQSCNTPTPDVISIINLPSSPFSAIPTSDGCAIFVSMSEGQDRVTQAHIAVLSRAAGKITLLHDIPVPNLGGIVAGMALSHDGKLLAVANFSGVLLLDVGRLMAGDGKPIVEAKDDADAKQSAGSVYVAISPDDKLLFVSDEDMASVTVYDLAKLRGGNTIAIGRIPVGEAPVGLVFSPDGRKLYTTSEEAKTGHAPATCHLQYGRGDARQGLLTVVDVARAASDPAGSVLAKVPGGCDPVRIALSTDGARAFVTARGVDSLLAFNTAKLVTDSDHALIATVIAGKAPVGVAEAGQYVVTSDSNRFAPAGRKSEWLSVIDPVAFKVVGNIPAGLFPRDLSVTADGKTLLVINSNSNSLELVALERLTPAYFAQEKPIKDADDAQQIRIQAALDERIKCHQAAPGAEAALRHIIEAFVRGMPDYDAMGPQVVNVMRHESARFTAQFQKFGALLSIAFKSTNPNGVDEFVVTFEHTETDWGISLSPDGKAAILGLDAVK